MDESRPSIHLYLNSLVAITRSASMLAGEAAIPIEEDVIDKFSSIIGKLLDKIDELT